MTDITEFAPAKLNLYLHITGRADYGYHDLDSLVAFADIGDVVHVRPAAHFGFGIVGPHAGFLDGENHDENLVVKAARSLATLVGRALDAHITLTKNLPVASGIGGGSADAAAVLRALARHWGLAPDDPRLAQAAALHGQDVPVCLRTENCYMTATGVITAPKLPCADIVLLNPNRGLSTPDVYAEYRRGGDAFSPLSRLSGVPANLDEMIDALRLRSNDLYAPACRLMPEITDMIAALRETAGCLLPRMSGSGATCFGIYCDAGAAQMAAQAIQDDYPEWWVAVGRINAAMPGKVFPSNHSKKAPPAVET